MPTDADAYQIHIADQTQRLKAGLVSHVRGAMNYLAELEARSDWGSGEIMKWESDHEYIPRELLRGRRVGADYDPVARLSQLAEALGEVQQIIKEA